MSNKKYIYTSIGFLYCYLGNWSCFS